MADDIIRAVSKLAAIDIVAAAAGNKRNRGKIISLQSKVENIIYRLANSIASEAGETDWLSRKSRDGWTDSPNSGEKIRNMSPDETMDLLEALGLDPEALGKMYDSQVVHKPELKDELGGEPSLDGPPPSGDIPPFGGGKPKPEGDIPPFGEDKPEPKGELPPFEGLEDGPKKDEPEGEETPSSKLGVDPVRKGPGKPETAVPTSNEFNSDIKKNPGLPGAPGTE